MDTLSIPKVRSRAHTIDLPMPQPEPTIEAYGIGRVLRAKADAEQRLSSITRKPSPLTKTSLKIYQAACNTYLLAAESNFANVDRKAICKEIQEYEDAFNKRYHMEIEKDQQIEEMKKELVGLRKIQLLARYGDYLAMICNELQTASEANKLVDAALMGTGKWAAIAKRAESELAQMKDRNDLELGPWISKNGQPLRTLSAIEEASRKAGIAFLPALYAVTQYGERNLLVHRDFKSMIKAGHFNELAEVLHADLTDIPAVFEDKEMQHRAFLTAILDKIIAQWYDRISPFEATPAAWRPKNELYAEAKAIAQTTATTAQIASNTKKAVERANKGRGS